MSEAYNPESETYAELQRLEIEARQLAKRRDDAPNDGDRETIGRQLTEVEARIEKLKKRLKPT